MDCNYKDVPKEKFIAMLVSRGWTQEDAEREWKEIQNDDEAGDGDVP